MLGFALVSHSLILSRENCRLGAREPRFDLSPDNCRLGS